MLCKNETKNNPLPLCCCIFSTGKITPSFILLLLLEKDSEREIIQRLPRWLPCIRLLKLVTTLSGAVVRTCCWKSSLERLRTEATETLERKRASRLRSLLSRTGRKRQETTWTTTSSPVCPRRRSSAHGMQVVETPRQKIQSPDPVGKWESYDLKRRPQTSHRTYRWIAVPKTLSLLVGYLLLRERFSEALVVPTFSLVLSSETNSWAFEQLAVEGLRLGWVFPDDRVNSKDVPVGNVGVLDRPIVCPNVLDVGQEDRTVHNWICLRTFARVVVQKRGRVVANELAKSVWCWGLWLFSSLGRFFILLIGLSLLFYIVFPEGYI